MDAMDYQMESPLMPGVNFNGPPSPPPRRCPYAFQQPNSNIYPASSAPHLQNQYFTQNGVSFVPSAAFNHHPLIWTHATYPLLPPPTPSTNINNLNRYHFPGENFSRGSADQQSLQSTNMSENAGHEGSPSSSWNAADSHPPEPANQSDSSDNERSSSDGSDFSTNSTAHHDRANSSIELQPNQRMLPPILSPPQHERSVTLAHERPHADGSAPSSLQSSFQGTDLAGPSVNTTPEATRQYSGRRRSQETNTGFSAFAGQNRSTLPPTAEGFSVPPPPNLSDFQRQRPTTLDFLRRRQRPSESSGIVDSFNEEAIIQSLRNDPAIEAFLDRHVPPLQDEENLRMDDPARLQNSAFRMTILRDLLRTRAPPPKKTGASKSAIESLVKVAVKDLKEDDRTCQICYNDYGVENPEGAVELPFQLPKCKHTFGEACLKKWLEDKSTCPYCRDQLPSDSSRSRRTMAERRRNEIAEQSSSREAGLTSWARRITDVSGESSFSAGDVNRLRRSDRMLQYEERQAALARGPGRQEPPMPPGYHAFSRTPPRRARGRGGSSGRIPQQADWGHTNSMRTPANSDAQQTPMRIPVGPASEAYGQNQSGSSFSDHTMPPMHNPRGGMSAGPARLPPNSSSFYEAPPSFPAQNPFSGFNPYADSYTPGANPPYIGAPTQDRDYRQYSRPEYPPATDYTPHNYGPSPSRFHHHHSNSNSGDWGTGFQSFLPGPGVLSSFSAEGIQAAEAEGERRTLMGMERDSQDPMTGQALADRQSNGNESTYPRYYNNAASTRDPFHYREVDRALDHPHENPRLQESQRAQGTYYDNPFSNAMQPPLASTHGNSSTEMPNSPPEDRMHSYYDQPPYYFNEEDLQPRHFGRRRE